MSSSRAKMSKNGSKTSKTRSKSIRTSSKKSADSGISSALPPMPSKYPQYPPMTAIPENEKRNDSPVFTNIMEKIKEVPTRIKDAPPKKFGKFGAALAVGGAAFGWIIFPYVLYRSLTGVMNLEPGGEVYEKWKVVPFSLDFNMYIFNVTNPDQVMNGAKPILQEVGPYRYEEWKTKEGIVDDPANDEMTYSNVNTFYFKKQETLPLTGDELVTIPHLPMMSMFLATEQDFPPASLLMVNQAVRSIYGKNRKSIFLTLKARELLFDGYPIDCTVKDMMGKTVCAMIKANSKSLTKNGKNKYLFSILGTKNGTPDDTRITIKKGTRDAFELAKVVRINGKDRIDAWKDECNVLSGTDGSIFPPYRTPDNTSINAYGAGICRNMRGMYVGDGYYKGVRGHVYEVELGDVINNPKDACYCVKKCYKKGTVDLSKCQGAPMIGSLAHFYAADPSYVEGVIGLKPEKEKHGIRFIVEPTTGCPMQARSRFQFSLDIHPIKYVNYTKKLRPTLFPIFWLEENMDLGPDMMEPITAGLLTVLWRVDMIKWTLIVLGSGIGLSGLVKHQMEKRQKSKHERGSSPAPSNTSRRGLLNTPPQRADTAWTVTSEWLNASRLTGMLKPTPFPEVATPHYHVTTPPDIYTLDQSLARRLSPDGLPPIEVPTTPQDDITGRQHHSNGSHNSSGKSLKSKRSNK